MAVSRDDVLRVAQLARLALSEARADALAGQLDGILAHMEVLRAVPVPEALAEGVEVSPPRLREDAGPSVSLARGIEAFAPDSRDGFFLVPRLASHEDPAQP